MNNILRNALAVIALLSASSSMKAQVETWDESNNINFTINYKPDHLVLGHYYNHIAETTSKDLAISGKAKISFTLKNITEFNNHNYMGYVMHVYVKNAKGTTVATKHYGFRQDRSGDSNGRFYKLTKPSTNANYYLYTKSEVVSGQQISDEFVLDNSEAGYYLYAETVPAYSENSDAAYGYTSYSGRSGTDGVRFGCDYQLNANSDYHGAVLTVLTSQNVRYDIYDDKPLWKADGEDTSVGATPILSNRMDVVNHSASVSSDGIKVTVHRKLVPNSWTTLCLPFDFKASDIKALGTNISISKFDNVNLEKDIVNFYTTNDETLKAGKPYLFWYDGEARESFDVTGVTFNHTASKEVNNLSTRKSTKKTKVSESDTDESLMYYYAGLLEPTAADASSESISGDACMAYIASPGTDGKQHVKKLSASGSIKGFRAYLYYPATASSNAAKGTDCISIDDILDGGATGIPTIAVDGTPVSNAIYNLNGQYVGTDASQLPRGIYVRGGKKFCK